MLNRYFDKRRPLANGLSAAGSPVFLCALSPLGQVLQHEYGWRGGFLILGGMLLNCCVCGALMRPLESPKKSEAAKEPAEKKAKKKLLDFSVFKDGGFIVYTLAASIMVLGLFVPPVFVVSYAKDLGYQDTKAAFLLTILGFIDIFARPVCGMVAGLKWVRPRCVYLFSFAMIFNGFTDLMGSMSVDYGGLVVFCIFFGISYGMVGALQFEVLMAIVGTQKFSSAIGLVLLAEAVAVLIGPPSAGKYTIHFRIQNHLHCIHLHKLYKRSEKKDNTQEVHIGLVSHMLQWLSAVTVWTSPRQGGMNLFPLGYISGLVELPSVGAAPSPLKTYTGPVISRWLILYEMSFTHTEWITLLKFRTLWSWDSEYETCQFALESTGIDSLHPMVDLEE